MYTEYFGLREKPFNATPDPRFLYVNDVCQEIYANLLYGILERKGFMVLTGEVGTGKTTLVQRLMGNLDATIRPVFLYNTTLTFEELLTDVCEQLGLTVEGLNRLQRLQALETVLREQFAKRGTVVLFVDEAQNLNDEALENLRMLSNVEAPTHKLVQIVLVGQPELTTRLEQSKLRPLRQRIVIRCQLTRLSAAEVAAFIDFRLRAAGNTRRAPLFKADAVRRIEALSRGVPRLINIICDNALLIAYATSRTTVSGTIIDEVGRDLQLSPAVPTPPDRSPARVPSDAWRRRAPSHAWRRRAPSDAWRRRIRPRPSGRRWALRISLGLALLLVILVAGGFAATRAGFIDQRLLQPSGRRVLLEAPTPTPATADSTTEATTEGSLELPPRPSSWVADSKEAKLPPSRRGPKESRVDAQGERRVKSSSLLGRAEVGRPEPRGERGPAQEHDLHKLWPRLFEGAQPRQIVKDLIPEVLGLVGEQHDRSTPGEPLAQRPHRGQDVAGDDGIPR
jgi:general secretion pathway protein A